MAAAAGGGFSYPESVANGWTGDCVTGTMQSPIDLDSSMEATVHAPIEYRNYFNGHFNKVNFIYQIILSLYKLNLKSDNLIIIHGLIPIQAVLDCLEPMY